jgi:hypothetical protein
MSEPRLEDDIAACIWSECDDCSIEHDPSSDCVYDNEPDRMWGDED